MSGKPAARTLARSIAALALAVPLAACEGGALAPSVAPAATALATQPASPGATPPGLEIVGSPFVAPVEACAGPRAWTGVPAIVIRLADAWHEPDGAARRHILEELWMPTSLYQDPYAPPVTGVAALAEVMGYGVAPGQYLELRSWDESDMHHGAIRLAWRHCCPSGLTILEGTDILDIGADGRISRNISFWSRYVEEAAENACDGPRMTAAPSDGPSAAPATSCKGPDIGWTGMPAVAQGYGKAWNERDRAARLALLHEVWADDGTFADPLYGAPILGREAFADDIGTFLDGGFGEYFEPRPIAEGDFHHGHIRIPWTYCDADGNVVWEGEDIADLDAEGRITRVLSFYVF